MKRGTTPEIRRLRPQKAGLCQNPAPGGRWSLATEHVFSGHWPPGLATLRHGRVVSSLGADSGRRSSRAFLQVRGTCTSALPRVLGRSASTATYPLCRTWCDITGAVDFGRLDSELRQAGRHLLEHLSSEMTKHDARCAPRRFVQARLPATDASVQHVRGRQSRSRRAFDPARPTRGRVRASGS